MFEFSLIVPTWKLKFVKAFVILVNENYWLVMVQRFLHFELHKFTLEHPLWEHKDRRAKIHHATASAEKGHVLQRLTALKKSTKTADLRTPSNIPSTLQLPSPAVFSISLSYLVECTSVTTAFAAVEILQSGACLIEIAPNFPSRAVVTPVFERVCQDCTLVTATNLNIVQDDIKSQGDHQ